MSGCYSRGRRQARGQRGHILIFGALTLFFVLIPAAGLAVDVGMMYLVKSLLSAASDGAALAGARAFSRGADDGGQRTIAESTASAYLHANFPTGYLGSSNLQVTPVAATDSAHVRSLTITASVTLPTIFLRLLRIEGATVSASSKATRRDINIMFVMDRSTSLQQSSSCTPLKNAAKGFIDKFAEGRDNVGLITFGTSSLVDKGLSTTFKAAIITALNNVACNGATNTAQGLWQAYQALVALNQPGALNAILLFTDGAPTAVTQSYPIKQSAAPTGSSCADKNPKQAAVYCVGCSSSSHPSGLYEFVGLTQPMTGGDTNRVITNKTNCYFASTQTNAYKDVQSAPLTDSWGNSLVTTGYAGTLSYYDANNLNFSNGQTMERGAMNAADHAGLRVRRGDVVSGSNSLTGVVIYAIGYGVNASGETLLKRIVNDPSLTPNPVAAGVQGKYEYAGDPAQLNDAFTRVASQVLRLAQ